MTTEDYYPCIGEVELEDGIWASCIVCGKSAMVFKNKVPLCRYCAAEGY